MRIGELAALIGVSTRSIRHYHHVGVLPEPERTPGGYRRYGLRDAVLLARAKRLGALGLTLAEVRDVLSDSGTMELREVLVELDDDLARQEEELRTRRARLAELLDLPEPHPDDAVSPQMAAVLSGLPATPGGVLAAERTWLAALDASASTAVRARHAAAMEAMSAVPALRGAYAELEALADAAPDDPRVPELAAKLAAALPAEALTLAEGELPPMAEEMLEQLMPAQAEVIRQMLARAGTS